MELKLILDADHKEEVVIYAHKETELVRAIQQLVTDDMVELLGYKDKEVFPLHPTQVYCFLVEDNKIYALCKQEKLQLKCRLYQLEKQLGQSFIRINQSCIANLQMIDRFDASLSGTLQVKFKNGYRDYVSRRNVKLVKERLGF